VSDLLKSYINEVLTGFKSLNTTGRDLATGNLRYGDFTLGHQNRGVLDDENDESQRIQQDIDSLPHAACVLIRRNDGKILSVSQFDDPLMRGMPRGCVDPGELPIDAVARELYEETGICASNFVPIFSSVDTQGFITTTFTCDVSDIVHTDKMGYISWVEPKILIDITMSPFADYNRKLFFRLGICN